MTDPQIDAIKMTRIIREGNHERLRGLSRPERLAYYREQASRMNARAATLAKTRGRNPERA